MKRQSGPLSKEQGGKGEGEELGPPPSTHGAGGSMRITGHHTHSREEEEVSARLLLLTIAVLFCHTTGRLKAHPMNHVKLKIQTSMTPVRPARHVVNATPGVDPAPHHRDPEYLC